MSWWLAMLAHAADAPSAAHVFYLLERGAAVEAAAEAGELLERDAGDLAAHRAYVAARSRIAGREELVPMYRRWLALSPDSEAARFGLAVALGEVGVEEAGA